jgi:hypothetical protein
MPNLHALLNAVLEADLWQMKCVGMQVIAESLALGSFKMMRQGTHDEVLKRIVELTAQDEARHVSYGLIYMKDKLPRMSEPDRNRVEDFALAGVQLLAAPENRAAAAAPLLEMLGEVGADVNAAIEEMGGKLRDREFRRAQANPFRDYVVPQLHRVGIITERTASQYREMGLEA